VPSATTPPRHDFPGTEDSILTGEAILATNSISCQRK
jgi:hypothetical protein